MFRKLALMGLATFATILGGSATALAAPEEASADFVADPPTDPFYRPDAGFETQPNGAILRSRWLPEVIPNLAAPGVVIPHHAVQLLVRSSDSKDRPIAAVTTVVIPAAKWRGRGQRPLVSDQLPINSLGAGCNPSAKVRTGGLLTQELPPILQPMLARGYAVSVPDHLGPRNAYSVGPVAGHVVNDTALAALTIGNSGMGPESPVAFTGYSGGAIATGWAVGLAPTYAPSLRVVGATVGGTPSDFSLLPGTMDRNIAVGLLATAVVGQIREFPEIEVLVNKKLATPIAKIFRNQCQEVTIAAGVPVGALGIGLQEFSTAIGDVYKHPLAQHVIAKNRMGQLTPTAPVLAVHGWWEQWIPVAGARQLKAEMCAKGVNWQLREYPGEHLLTAAWSLPDVLGWLSDRLEGIPAANGCSK